VGRKLDKIIKHIMIAIFVILVRDLCLRKFWISDVMKFNYLIHP
jgi:hypothetical protein